jgi:DNA-binding response OmpR family regulator
MRVLVLDDETFVAELVKLALEADGHLCYAAGCIEDAAEIVRRVRLDVLALDLVRGNIDPLAWTEELVLAFPELHGRILVLTGRPLDDGERLRLNGCGATVMPKPFTLHGLREEVAKLGSAREPRSAALRARPPESPRAEDS